MRHASLYTGKNLVKDSVMNKAKIQTLTPVHTGSGKKYKHHLEFFSEGGYIYIIDPDKIFQRIGIEGIEDWVSAINKNSPIKEFLKNRKLNYKPEEISLRKCELSNEIKKEKELHEQLYSPLYGPCIPGSSIKGAIKTALLDYISDNKEFINSKIKLSDVKKQLKNQGGKKWQWHDEEADKILFGEDANHKSTRFLKIGDAYFTTTKTKVYFTLALNADTNTWKLNKNIANLYEAIPENAFSFFKLKFDEVLFKANYKEEEDKWNSVQFEFLKTDLHTIIKIINEASKKSIEKEIDFFENIQFDNKAGWNLVNEYKRLLETANTCNNNEFILRIGANSGYNFTTLRWIDKLAIFQPLPTNKDYADLRQEIQKNKKDYRREKLWPRTRKVITTGVPFGFVKITILSEEEFIEQGQKSINELRVISRSLTPPVKEPPKPYRGTIKQGTDKIPSQVIKSGKPNIVRVLIENNETELPLSGYKSEIEKDKYIYVRITIYRNGKIEQVNFDGEIK